jgi:serine/threonine-protein kinase
MITVPGQAPVLESGYTHSCAVTSMGAFCWGDNAVGEIGDGTTGPRRMPARIPGIGSNARIAAGDSFTCALEGGAVSCWGDNTRGQLGIGALSRSLVPVEVAFP